MYVSQLIGAVAYRKGEISQELTRISEERQRYERDAADLEARRERNGLEMAGYLLPDLDDDDLVALEKRLRYPVLIRHKRETEVELAQLDLERVRIEADPRFRDRAVLRIDYENQLAEIADAAEGFVKERALWEASPHFRRLRERGWFEPDYDGGLFDWLRDWRSCSLLMVELERDFPGRTFPDDDDVKRAWRTHFDDSEPVLRLRVELQAQQAEIDRLEARHAELVAAPELLFQVLWKRLAALIVEHLRDLPEEVLVELGRGDDTLATFLKKDVGLLKQASYLQQLVVARINPYWKRLEQEKQKLDRKEQKLRFKQARGKFVLVGPGDVANYRTIPQEKWEARRASFAKTRERVSGFSRWDHGHFVDSFLWWDLITRGARGDDLYEVRVFHEQNPGWSVDSFHDPLAGGAGENIDAANDLAAAEAVDSMLRDDADGDGLFDAS